jgi:hypothetical protein
VDSNDYLECVFDVSFGLPHRNKRTEEEDHPIGNLSDNPHICVLNWIPVAGVTVGCYGTDKSREGDALLPRNVIIQDNKAIL